MGICRAMDDHLYRILVHCLEKNLAGGGGGGGKEEGSGL